MIIDWPCARRLVTGGYDSRVCVWDVRTGECTHTLTGHTNGVTSVVHDGERIITGDNDGEMRAWRQANTGDYVCEHVFTAGYGCVRNVLSTGKHIVICLNSRNVARAWNVNTGVLAYGPILNQYRNMQTSLSSCLCAGMLLTDDGAKLIAANNEGIHVRRAFDGHVLGTATMPAGDRQRFIDDIYCMSLVPGHNDLLVTVTYIGCVDLWNVDDGARTCLYICTHVFAVTHIRTIAMGVPAAVRLGVRTGSPHWQQLAVTSTRITCVYHQPYHQLTQSTVDFDQI